MNTFKKILILLMAFAYIPSLWADITVEVPDTSFSPGTVFTIPVVIFGADTAGGGTPICGVDIKITFNPDALTFMQVLNYNSLFGGGWYGNGNNTAGWVTANWLESNLNAIPIPDGTVIFEIKFTAKPGFSNLTFTKTDFLDVSINLIPTTPQHGTYMSLIPINLQVMFESLWTGSAMSEAQGESGPQFGTGIADQIDVELHHGTPPYATALLFNDVNLSINGMASMVAPGTHTGAYYIVVKNRNCLETWSAVPVSFSVNPISYDFTDVASKAYGDNQAALSLDVYGLFGGDTNQDGVVDSNDMGDVDNDANNFVFGYVTTDVNGDGIVDSNDMGLVDNNANAFIFSMIP